MEHTSRHLVHQIICPIVVQSSTYVLLDSTALVACGKITLTVVKPAAVPGRPDGT
jgi:hypothetical protein